MENSFNYSKREEEIYKNWEEKGYFKPSMDKTKETTLDCFAYVMRSDRPIGIPSDYYVYTCLEGYEYFGFDKRLLINAVNRMRRILCKRMK